MDEKPMSMRERRAAMAAAAASEQSAPVKLETFKVAKTAIFDYHGERVEPGEYAELDSKLAKKFYDLGYITIPLPEFGDDDADANAENAQADT